MANTCGKSSPKPTLLVVAVLLIDAAARVLVQRRPIGTAEAGLWEFPGGKVEQEESPATAIIRELREELGIHVEPGSLQPLSFTTADRGECHLVLLLYSCRRWTGEPQPLHATRLGWQDAAGLRSLDLLPADRDLLDAITAALAVQP